MKIDSMSISSMLSPDRPRQMRVGVREMILSNLRRARLYRLFFFQIARIGFTIHVPRPNLRRPFKDSASSAGGGSGSCGVCSSSLLGHVALVDRPWLPPGGYGVIADDKTVPPDNVQRPVETNGTVSLAAVGNVDTRPMSAIWNGKKVITAATRFGINRQRGIKQQRRESISECTLGLIKRAAWVDLGKAVASFDWQYGIATCVDQTRLRSTATQHFALSGLENGSSAQPAIKQFSITDEHSGSQSTQAAARVIVGFDLNGGNTSPQATTMHLGLFPATPGGSSGLASNAMAPAADKSSTSVKNQ